MSQSLRCFALLAALLATGLVGPGCARHDGSQPNHPYTQAPPPTKEALAQASAANGLGFRLCAELQREAPRPNLFLSPLSLHLALSMTYNGAAGKTAEAMAKTLGLAGLRLADVNAAAKNLMAQLTAEQSVQLLLADSVWCDQRTTFLPTFLDANKANYAAEIRNVNLRNAQQAADQINAWTKDKTQGKIPEIVTAQNLDQAVMVLVNALYFKGSWAKPFEVGETKDGPFHLANGTTKTLPMMQRSGSMEYHETESYQAVRLPYRGFTTRMIVFLPKPGKTPAEVLGKLTAKTWSALRDAHWVGDGDLQLPRFKADYAQSLLAPLKSLGMGAAFDPNAADFSKMIGGGGLFISDVLHRCVVEVNEEGTVAAAATAAPPAPGAPAVLPGKRFTMIVDRPFVFALEQIATGSLLFVGAIGEPG